MHNQTTIEGVYLHRATNVEVAYRFRPAIDDRRHLVVVLSGFRDPVHSVDFNAASKDIVANILWIYDDFDGKPGYYYWGKNLKDLSLPVHSAIMEIAHELGLTQENVTLFGLSKGANAALLFAAEYGYSKIIASAPRAFNGTSMRTYHSDVFQHIADTSDSTAVETYLNQALTAAVARDTDLKKSIFVATSPADVLRYYNESTTISKLFNSYENFHVIHSLSPLLRNHIDVSRYNLPLYKSLLLQFSEGFVPKLKGNPLQDPEFSRRGGTIEKSIVNGYYSFPATENRLIKTLEKRSLDQQLRAKAESVELSDTGLLNFRGYAVLNGTPSDRHGLAKIRLTLNAQTPESEPLWFPLGTLKDDSLTGRLFDKTPIDYSYGAVTTQQEKGVRVSELPFGRYDVGVEMTRAGEVSRLESIGAPRHSRWVALQDRLVGSISDGGKWKILSLPPRGRHIHDCFFDLKEIDQVGSRLFVEGYFIPYGFNVKEWDDLKYHLVLESLDKPNGRNYTRVFQLSNGRKANASRLSGEPWRDQSKAYFTTRNYAGLDLQDLQPGKYRMAISGRRGDDVFTRDLGWIMEVELSGDNFNRRQSSVAIIGSCVTRDNFNSKISPHWKEFWDLRASFYQSSIISLMSSPVAFDSDSFCDQDDHSRHITEEDFSKQFIDRIVTDKPAYLIVDLFADARFGVVSTGPSWVTHNEWKLVSSIAYREFRSNRILSRRRESSLFFELFAEKCVLLKEFLNSYCPETIVCLNVTRNVGFHRGLNADGGRFSHDAVSDINRAWERLDNIFIDTLAPIVLSTLDYDVQGASDHPWGSGPVHYETAYYERFHKRLRSALGLYSDYTLSQAV